MDELRETVAPWHLWVVGVVSLLWNAMGATDYTMTQLENRGWYEIMGFDERMTDAAIAFFDSTPWWADVAWAFGVWGGLVGSLLLLARNRWAVTAFGVSIAGVVASMIYQARTTWPESLAEMENSPMMWVVLAIALGLLFYASAMKKRGVLA
jgi:hypothetical protein